MVRESVRKHGYLAAAVAVALATLLFVPTRTYIDFAHVAWLYVGVVGLVAWLAGTRPALLAAALSFVAGAYFTPPVGALWVSKPVDLIQLIVFFAGAAGIGALTGQVRRREQAALKSEREATALAQMASEMAQGHDLDAIVESAVAYLGTEPDVDLAVVWLLEPDKELTPHGPDANRIAPGHKALAQRSAERIAAINLSDSALQQDRLGAGWPAVESEHDARPLGTFIPLVSSHRLEGVLQVSAGPDGLSDRTASVAVSISHLLAVFVSSEKAIDTATKIQGAEEAARVKSVIVSAVSHELKTPLAAAVAGVTDLISEDVARDPSEMRKTLRAVADDLERLQTAIADLLDLSRLQSEEWMPHPDLYEAGEILGDVVASSSPELRERLVFRVKERPVPEVCVDFAQVSRALRAVLDNAVVYSPSSAPIFLGAERRDDRTVIWIEDRGTGVSDQDKPFVFDAAFRGEAGVRRPGSTGLGLTIARDLIHANNGFVRVEDALPTGTRILIDLPTGCQ